MPLNMTMKKPNPRVIRLEPQHHITVRIHHKRVPAHRYGGESFVHDIVSGVGLRAHDGLEVVAVEMEGVFTRVFIVDDYFDGLAFLEDEGVGVGAVDERGHSGCGGREGGIEGGDFGVDVGYVIEESAGGSG